MSRPPIRCRAAPPRSEKSGCSSTYTLVPCSADFRINIVHNHATLAGHTIEHEVRTAFENGLFGSIDINHSDPHNGWDTDECLHDIPQAALFMLEILQGGGLAPGGLNFDAKVRRSSTDLEDLFISHISSMDTLARGLLIADTILHSAEQSLGGLGDLAFINLMFWIEVGMSFFVPSSSGLAVLSMPILAPLADFAGVERSLVVTAYQSANGLVNLINPTFAVVIGGLAIGRVSYDRWLVFIWPLLLVLTIFITAALSVAALV